MTDALVAVVVIVHNDPNRLPQAVASALAQSLRAVEVVIVDDASTDNTPEVAAQLARDHDRVSFVRLDTNSGAPGTPRNAGIAASSAPFLFFLDSDDTIDHHACRNLYEAAVRTGSDIVSGRIVRVHLDQGGRVTPWYEWLYRSTVTYQDVDEQPDLLYDTISTNKLYRREFLDREGLRFPDGRQYEDLLFTAKAYCLARGITLIPPVVYFWNVAEKATSLSITNRRDDITGLENRLSIHHDIDAFFAEHGREALRNHKDVKFLKQDLRLYLNDLPLRTPEFHERFMTLMGAYLEHIGPEAYDKADRLLAVAAHLIRRRDARRLVALSAYLTQGRKLDVDLVREGGRIFWGLPQDDEDREWLDVTSLGWQDLPLAKLPLTSTISELSCEPRQLNISAETRNHFGRIPRDAVFTVRVRQRGG
ncbi:MAG: glycosyltransferase family 2 protein, partial [Actinomycetes bacterium]